MLWAPCIRVDLPEDAPPEQAQALAGALEQLLEVIESGEVTLVTVAVSGAALTCFERAGLSESLARLADLADADRLELVGTAAHGALLPLLPPREAARQVLLNDELNRRWFGDNYRPECLWSPRLAISPGLAALASDLGWTCLLVDEAAMHAGPSPWPGRRIDAIAGIPGFFLLPVSRAGSEALQAGRIRSLEALQSFLPVADPGGDDRYLITAIELTADSRAAESIRACLDQVRTARLEDLLDVTPLDQVTSPLPCSSLSTPGELERDQPFAAWFDASSPTRLARWQLLLKAEHALRSFEENGLSVLPAVARLRTVLDLTWRESNLRSPPPGSADPLVSLRMALEDAERTGGATGAGQPSAG